VKPTELITNLAWYIVITFIIGQAPVAYTITASILTEAELAPIITQLLNSGAFLTFSIAILASSCFHFIHEYNGSNKIDLRKSKSVMLLIALGLIAISATLIKFVTAPLDQVSETAKTWHWWVYSISTLFALVLWVFFEIFPPQRSTIRDEIDEKSQKNLDKAKSLAATPEGIDL